MPGFDVVGVIVTVVVLTVVGFDDVEALEDEADVDEAAADEVGVEPEVLDCSENRGWRNSVHESRYSTVSPSETSNMVGDTA